MPPSRGAKQRTRRTKASSSSGSSSSSRIPSAPPKGPPPSKRAAKGRKERQQCPEEEGQPPTLRQWLLQEPYSLALAPAFFGFYSFIGALTALEEAGLLSLPGQVNFVSGASAGALVGGMLAGGMTPSEMREKVMAFKRSDFWDVGLGLGLLKGQAFQRILENLLPVQCFEQCLVPLGISAFCCKSLSMKALTSGPLASAMRASATFPVLFQPVSHEEGLLIDGGVKDTAGLWCIPVEGTCFRRILHVSLSGGVSHQDDPVIVAPSEFPAKGSSRPRGCEKEIVSLCLSGLPPRPHPFDMEARGRASIDAAYGIVKACLDAPVLPGKEKNHWIADLSCGERHPKTTPRSEATWDDDMGTKRSKRQRK